MICYFCEVAKMLRLLNWVRVGSPMESLSNSWKSAS